VRHVQIGSSLACETKRYVVAIHNFTPSPRPSFPFSNGADERSFLFLSRSKYLKRRDYGILDSVGATCLRKRARATALSESKWCVCVFFWKFHSGFPSFLFIIGCWTLGVGALTFFLSFHLRRQHDIHFCIFTRFFLAEASLRWEAQGRQDQPPIDTALVTSAAASICSISSPVLHCSVVVHLPYPFHDIEHAHCVYHHTRYEYHSDNLRGMYLQRRNLG
jgi:hypothetical protein